jgi:hypothetical protein
VGEISSAPAIPAVQVTTIGRLKSTVMDLAAVKMDFRYDDWFPKEPNVG